MTSTVASRTLTSGKLLTLTLDDDHVRIGVAIDGQRVGAIYWDAKGLCGLRTPGNLPAGFVATVDAQISGSYKWVTVGLTPADLAACRAALADDIQQAATRAAKAREISCRRRAGAAPRMAANQRETT